MRWALGRFCERLRRDGVRVSAAELLDAARAVSVIDVTDRERLHDALATTLAKSRSDQEILAQAFARFFVAPPLGGGGRRRRRRKRRARGAPEGTGSGGEAPDTPRDAAGTVRSARRRMLEADRRPSRPADARRRYPTEVLTARRREAGAPAIERHRSLAAAFEEREREGRGRRPHRAQGSGPRPDAPRRRSARALVATKPFRSRFDAADAHALAELIERTLRRMRLRRVRRRRRARRGAIWVQRVVRANLAHEGVPFRLVRHAPARREPRVVLLVDVSHSVARAASAFFALATQLTRSLRSVHALAFVDDVADVTRELPRLARLRGETEPLERLVDAHDRLDPGALSDYGRVLYRLLEEHRRTLRHDTVVIVLGDARTNRFDPAAWVLEEIRARVKRVVWLVPEPLREWDTGDSVVAAYAPHVDLLAETADLVGLRAALGRTLSGGRRAAR